MPQALQLRITLRQRFWRLELGKGLLHPLQLIKPGIPIRNKTAVLPQKGRKRHGLSRGFCQRFRLRGNCPGKIRLPGGSGHIIINGINHSFLLLWIL